jgi:hypothetical protein
MFARLLIGSILVGTALTMVGCARFEQTQPPPNLPPLAYAPRVDGSDQSINRLTRYLRHHGYTHISCTKAKHELDCEATNTHGKHIWMGFPFHAYNCSPLTSEADGESVLECSYRASRAP